MIFLSYKYVSGKNYLYIGSAELQDKIINEVQTTSELL